MLLIGQAAPARGGIPSFLDALAGDTELAKRADVRLLNTTRKAERKAGTLTGSNVVHALEDAWRTYRKARDADVVHLQTALLPALPLLRALAICAAARIAGAGVICHVHHAGLNTGRKEALAAVGRLRPLLRLLCPMTDRVLAVSDPGTLVLRELVPGLSLATVHNAVDVDSFLVARPERQPPSAVYVGTLTRRKGLFDLAAALDLLVDRDVQLPVEVIGGSNEVGEVEAKEVRAAVRTSRGRFTLAGSLGPAQVRERLAQASLFVLPSHSEGQPIAILEAMAAGLPVVVTSIGANPDVVRDGIDGLVVPPHDPVRLAYALERLAREPLLRQEMGAAARERASTRFDRSVLRERLLHEYTAVMRSQGESRA